VFGSIAYLAVQIRRNSLATAHASQNSFVADYNAQLAQLYTNDGLVELIQRGVASFASLSETERAKLHAYWMAQTFTTMNTYFQRNDRHFDGRLADPVIRYVASIYKSPGGNQWWQSVKALLDQEYVLYMDKLVGDPAIASVAESQDWWVTTDSA
jgi:hypothetical protein